MNARAVASEAAARLKAAGVADAQFEAELLTREAAGVSRAQYFSGVDLSPEESAVLSEWVDRRERREPAPYITGHREFFGREFGVGTGVLVPRPETELLVELGLEELTSNPAAIVVEVGTGSGAVAVSIAAERSNAIVVATEVSAAAMGFAQANARTHAPNLGLVLGNLATPIRRRGRGAGEPAVHPYLGDRSTRTRGQPMGTASGPRRWRGWLFADSRARRRLRRTFTAALHRS